MFKLVIIDLDGTLVDSKKDITLTLNQSLEFFGLTCLSEEIIASHVGTGIKPLIIENVPEDLQSKFYVFFEKNYIKNIAINTRLFDGWTEFLNSTPQVEKVILSNKLQKFCDPLVSSLGLNEYFSNVFGGDAFKESKPSGYPILEILKMRDLKEDQALMIGDTTTDIISAKNARIASCAVKFGYGNIEDMLKLHPDYTITNPTELLKYFTRS